ncbi:MBL fold metallo-hydrolase [Alkalimarinus sediminis]|uniref:MBL fold metallo-hydrolase n=1 Tax=Alkalimarinus sediminis TaxID=1632866 RepID=A0A9E8KPW7_9ALTE|nr:MBL fold metallo-hydrolase [Alkalimarinus sediminis]UZW73972.1 MBL fold metallo-hydrolase [Alkalimarinus sediminis]
MAGVKDLLDNPFADRWHHHNGRFRSPPGSPWIDRRHSKQMLSVLGRLAVAGNQPFQFSAEHCLSRDVSLRMLGAIADEPSISWLGQACFYIQFKGVKVLTDPFLSERASPLRYSGPKRLVPTPLQLQDLSPDVMVISHNHYDHLDTRALGNMVNKANVTVITTLKTGKLLRKLGFSRVIEMDWYQEFKERDAIYQCLPAYHFSGRSLLDENRALWGSFSIECGGVKVFFAGDTGYGTEFSRIGRLTGPYDVALVPIGAYAPRDVFAAVHASPEEAVKIGEDIAAKHLIGMHWGTIRLTTEAMGEPAERFIAAQSKVTKSIMAIGETRKLVSV